MKTKNIRLTDRDIVILQFINRFGMCQMPQLSEYFKLNTPYREFRADTKCTFIKHIDKCTFYYGIKFETINIATETELPRYFSTDIILTPKDVKMELFKLGHIVDMVDPVPRYMAIEK